MKDGLPTGVLFRVQERTSRGVVVEAFMAYTGGYEAIFGLNDENTQPAVDWCAMNGVVRTSFNRFLFKDPELLTAFALRFGLKEADND